jgi:hypothetical protein
MRRNLIRAGQWFVTVLILAIGLSSYGCGDSASVSEDVAAPLSSLTVTPGTLQPAFFANTTNYAVNAPTSATSVTVAAVPKDTTATVTIDGIIATQRSVALGGPGSTKTILIVVETQTGLETTYTVTVTRLLSSNNNLSALTVTPGTLNPSPFNANTLDYTVNVSTNVTSVTVSATKSDPTAVMLIDSILISPLTVPGGTPSSGPVNIPLTGPGTNTVASITVTAPNGSKKTYRVTIKRLSGDNNLRELTVTPGTFNLPFDPGITDYIVDVASDVERVTISATKSDPNASMSGPVTAGPGIPTGTETLNIGGQGSSTDFLITVAATDPNVIPKTYKITVRRATPAAPPVPTIAPDLIPEDDSCFRDSSNLCVPPTSDSDNITNVTTPRFRIPQPGSGESPSLYVNGTRVDATFDQGTNALKPTAVLSDGTYPITYTVANVGGESAQSPPLIVTIDTSILGLP